MGDIPKPDSSILSKNIFIEGATNTHQSQGTATGSQNNQTTLNKRNRSRDSLVNSDDLQKKLKYTQEEDDDSFVDAQILSAAVVRKPFT